MNLDLDLLFTNPLYIIKKKFRDQIRKYGNQITGLTLDVGCGKRPFVKFIASERYVGLEQNVRLKPDVVSNAAYLPFRDGVFDSLLCTEVLEHVPEPKQVIEEISRVLKEGGKVYITTPMMWYLHYEPHDYYRFTKYGLLYLLGIGNLKVIAIEKNGGLLRFLSARIAEETFTWVHRACFLFRFNRVLRDRISLFLLAPISLMLLVVTEVLDRFSTRDVYGWAVLAIKNKR